jgi:hypothetical protein
MTELAEVEQHLHDATAELFPTLSADGRHPVAQQPPTAQSRRRVGGWRGGARSYLTTRSQRIYLAAALEMLHLAIAVHIMLADAAASDPANRSLLGSTILAGDYCFSRSASTCRAHRQRCTVVEIFSDALKRVSEGHLRHIFAPTTRATTTKIANCSWRAPMPPWNWRSTPARARREITSLVATARRTDQLYRLPPQPTRCQTFGGLLDRHQLERWRAFLRWRDGA